MLHSSDSECRSDAAQPTGCACGRGEHAEHEQWKPTVVAEKTEVLINAPVNDEYMHLVVRCGDESAAAAPGQFFQLLCPQSDAAQPFFRRPMSLYGADPVKNTVEFLYKVAGKGTRGLATLRQNDRLDIMGPLGVGFAIAPEVRHIVAVGRGAGLATLAPLAQVAKERGIAVTALFSARNPGMLMSTKLFEKQGATVIPVVDSDGSSDLANVEKILRDLIAQGRCQALYTCGSARLMLLLQRLGNEFSIPGQVALEEQMACGIGLCHCCVRKFNVDGKIVTRRVCAEGPVFDLKEAMAQ